MAKRKKTNNNLQNTTHKTKNRTTLTLLKQRVNSGKQFLLHMWHPSCYSCYKPSDKSRMMKGPDCDYDKMGQIRVTKSLWRKTFEVISKFFPYFFAFSCLKT
jgi:hypothetical protein